MKIQFILKESQEDEDLEREEVEWVFGVIGETESDVLVAKLPDGSEWKSKYWFIGRQSDHHGVDDDYITVFRECLYYPPPEIISIQNEGIDGITGEEFKKIESWTTSGETECRYAYNDFDNKITPEHVDKNQTCRLCGNHIGEEHGYIYIGDGWMQIVYQRAYKKLVLCITPDGYLFGASDDENASEEDYWSNSVDNSFSLFYADVPFELVDKFLAQGTSHQVFSDDYSVPMNRVKNQILIGEFEVQQEIDNEQFADALGIFLSSYIETALWSSTDENGDPLEQNYNIDDISEECKTQMNVDCSDFLESNWNDIMGWNSRGPRKAGHDFWLTRNRHGAGFWDGGWQDDVAKKLTSASHSYGEFDLEIVDPNRREEENIQLYKDFGFSDEDIQKLTSSYIDDDDIVF